MDEEPRRQEHKLQVPCSGGGDRSAGRHEL